MMTFQVSAIGGVCLPSTNTDSWVSAFLLRRLNHQLLMLSGMEMFFMFVICPHVGSILKYVTSCTLKEFSYRQQFLMCYNTITFG